MREIRLCPAEMSDSCVQFPAFSSGTHFLLGREMGFIPAFRHLPEPKGIGLLRGEYRR
jgi:hypothetical protein